ncbi:hypothetical protein ACFQDD_00425 [Halorubrum pallidum]|uniref:Uncharacterized protein n=1 Tax=Halorubrum pallidum TaxID=1526114 RepID=A0ABD5T1A8_9EURY
MASTESTTLSEYRSAAEENSEMSRILNMDEAVDELTAIQIKDVYVRGAVLKCIMDNTRPYPGRDDDPVKSAEDKLKSGSQAVFKEVAIAHFKNEIVDQLGWEDGPGNVEVLWDVFTTDTPEHRKIQIAREKIKTALRGCGMPRITVQRETVKYHHNHPDELTVTEPED